MNYKIVLAVLIAILAVGIVFFVRINQNSDVNVTTGDVVNDNNSISVENTLIGSKINEQVLSQHSTSADCWIVFEGKVYDVTSFLPKHPGGIDKILPHCGKTTFEEAFIKKHGRSKVSMLMKVGTLIGDFDVVGMTK